MSSPFGIWPLKHKKKISYILQNALVKIQFSLEDLLNELDNSSPSLATPSAMTTRPYKMGGVVSLERDCLLVFYYLSASKF